MGAKAAEADSDASSRERNERGFPAERAVGPFGVASLVTELPRFRGLFNLYAYQALAGSAVPGVGCPPDPVIGYGASCASESTAKRIAIAEAMERYSAGDFLGEERQFARAAELSGQVLDLDRVPRCSEREYADPRCTFAPPDPDSRIRWVRGYDLMTGDSVWIPAVMACYTMRDLLPGERFTFQISTGYAVHTDPVEAMIRGIFEVIERDAISLIWLQKLAPPRLNLNALGPAGVHGLVDWADKHFIKTFLFDATTDLGIPTVYCLQLAEHDSLAHQVLGCNTARTFESAATKAVQEATLLRFAFHASEPVPTSFADFKDAKSGGRYMGVPERLGAFDFLFNEGGGRVPHAAAQVLPGQPDQTLSLLCSTLRSKNMPVYVVDRTASELAELGLTAVSVIIPDLQPMSLYPVGNFLGHRRLRDAPASMGIAPLPEESMNSWPQPFM